MLEKIKDSFFWEVEKRFKNPFLWAFLISWIFWNWKFIYVLLFIDEKYVSISPNIFWPNMYFTKLEYILSLNIIDLYNCLLYPIATSILFVVFVEWITTYMIIILNNVKNNILKNEKLTKEESQDLKNELRKERKKYSDLVASDNNEILSLQEINSEYKIDMEQKVTERLRIAEDKNIKRIEELEENLKKSEVISLERLNKNNNLSKEFNDLTDRHKNEINELRLKITESKNEIDKIDNAVDKYKKEYQEFKKNYLFQQFDDLIDYIQTDRYSLSSRFTWKDIMYLDIKWIIEIAEDNEWDSYYRFTDKWNKFAEYFLENYNWNRYIKGEKEINIEDIPF
ncbi:MAG: hypothetical protein ACD_2C00053G0002 [uncultured bacterium (gcode 4)]|uniref:Uncharacterized protein n=1 Tax=uncultured bacterium (gcode 4) TaxID=1234023 RepID=K2FFV3_9BACT|nr:MAG: hypothetical protein ACD_2C00053G0002 [uncultured bacterium (gcode 4)]